jgi:NAD(P)H-dependent flavin oxidoreductase YrpB (nitropropane dioxygenase family)
MVTTESPIHHDVKQAIVDNDENSTILVLRKFRNTTRLYKNKVASEVFHIENTKQDATFADVAHLMAGSRGRGVYETGDIETGVWSLGQCAGLIYDIPTCMELTKRIEREAEDHLGLAARLVEPKGRL